MTKKNKKHSNIISIIIGAVVGFINGFFGGGGGMVCVPFLENFMGYENKQAHATTLCVILPLSIFSCFVYLYKNDLNFFDVIFITLGAVVGGIVGALFLKKLNAKWVRIIFAILMLGAGIKMVI